MQDKIELGLLLDYYGAFLTENRRELLSLSVNEDFSLGEIAEMKGISRQAVRDALLHGEKQLCEMEHKLGLIARDSRIIETISELKTEMAVQGIMNERIDLILSRLIEITEGENGI